MGIFVPTVGTTVTPLTTLCPDVRVAVLRGETALRAVKGATPEKGGSG